MRSGEIALRKNPLLLLLFYVPKKSKVVLMLSSMHNYDKIYEST